MQSGYHWKALATRMPEEEIPNQGIVNTQALEAKRTRYWCRGWRYHVRKTRSSTNEQKWTWTAASHRRSARKYRTNHGGWPSLCNSLTHSLDLFIRWVDSRRSLACVNNDTLTLKLPSPTTTTSAQPVHTNTIVNITVLPFHIRLCSRAPIMFSPVIAWVRYYVQANSHNPITHLSEATL